MKVKHYTSEDVRVAVQNSTSYRQVLIKIGLAPLGGNYACIQKYIKSLNFDTSHFTGKCWNKDKKFPGSRQLSLEEICVEHSTYANSHRLKTRLIREGILQRRCSCCGNNDWLSKEIPLELDHINGVKTDNRLNNLRLLCPNCHAQTETYRGKNQTRTRQTLREVIKNFCIVCKTEINSDSIRCRKCTNVEKGKHIPNKEILQKEVQTLGICKTGNKYKVTPTTIRRWLRK